MKISSEQLRALQEQERLNKKPGAGVGAFGEILSGHMEQAQSAETLQQTSLAALLPLSIDQEDQDAFSNELMPDSMKEAADGMEGLLDALDGYATQLASGGDNLRQTYGLLQGMGQQVSDFKSRFPNAAQRPELAAMLNEVEVLVTTETFKFNRGDYA